MASTRRPTHTSLRPIPTSITTLPQINIKIKIPLNRKFCRTKKNPQAKTWSLANQSSLATVSLNEAVKAGSPLSHEGKKCGMVLSCVDLDEGTFAWAVVDKTVAPGTTLDAATLLHFA